MIDFIKSLNINTSIPKLLNNKYLDFESKFNVKTGETNENRKIAKYKDLTFEIVNNKYVNLKGSLHKYFNNGEHNYNDFSFENLLNVIIDICKRFDLNPYLVPINNVEFAVNINVSVQPKKIIKEDIINHKGQPASIKTFKGKGYFKEFEHEQYYIKIYDKGLHQNQPDNIFRFEIKVVKIKYLQKIGIKNLADLLNIEKMQSLGHLLVEKWNELLIYHDVKLNIFTSKQKDIILNGRNPMFWEKLKPNSKKYKNGNENIEYKKNRKKYNRKLTQFKKLIIENNANKIQKDLSNKIYQKWNELIYFNIKKRDKLTDFLKVYENKKGDKLTDFLNIHENIKKGQINTSNIELICPQSSRKCLVTNLDISMQKYNSKFLSISGIKYYYKNEPETFNKLKKRLSQNFINADLNTQFREIAHSIRNEKFNIKNNTKRRITKELQTPSLFNNMLLIDKNKLEIAGIRI